MVIDRWTLDELVTRYELEPEIKDIFVEGATDQRIVKWVLSNLQITQFQVYEINSIDVYVSEGGNKSKIISSAKKINEKIDTANNIAFVADADADYVESEFDLAPQLFFTDFACLEAYTISTTHLADFAATFFGEASIFSSNVVSGIFESLRFLFAVRVCSYRIDRDPIVSFKKNLRVSESDVSIEQENYIRKIAQSQGEKFEKLQSCINTKLQNWTDDVRYTMNGHNFCFILANVARQKGVQHKLCDTAVVERAIWTNMDSKELQGYPLFEKLARFLMRQKSSTVRREPENRFKPDRKIENKTE